MIRRALLLLVPALAWAGPPDEEMGRRLQEALRAQRGEVHRCYAAALARDPKAQGELLVRVELGEGGKVRKVEIPKDQTNAPGLAECLVQSISTWSMPQLQAAPGEQVIFPLVFKPDQALVADVVIPEATAIRARGKLNARVYIEPGRQPGTLGALALLTIGRADRLPQHRHDSAEVLYVLSGQGQVLSGEDFTAAVGPGDGIFVPAGVRHTLRASTGELLNLAQVFAPPGAEQAYLERRPRAGQDVVRAAAPEGLPQVVKGTEREWLPILDGRGQVRILLPRDGAGLPASLAELTCEAGAEVPLHQHDTSDELLYIVRGQGVMTAGERKGLKVGAGDAVRVPRGVPHSLTVTERMVAIQSYTPSGPEQRFRKPPAKKESPQK
jgi:putative monooxygenase